MDRKYLISKFKSWDKIEKLSRALILSEDELDKKSKIRKESLLLESNFYEFYKAAWPLIVNEEYNDNWHLKDLCDHLQAVAMGKVLNLIVNLPPRFGKSALACIAFPAWVFTRNPGATFLFASVSKSLGMDQAGKCRSLIQSHWYQDRWGYKVCIKRDANSKGRFYTTAGGFRMVTSVAGTIIGDGAMYRVIDDPNSLKTADSPIMRESTNLWYDGTFASRISSPKTTATVLLQQRLAFRDMTGHLLTKPDYEKWVHFYIPMRFEPDRRCSTIQLPNSDKVWEDPRQEEGELLWPSLWGEKEVAAGEASLNSSHLIAGQYQQRPAPPGGSIIKEEWFNIWNSKLPPMDYIIQSWDTALATTKESADSACTTWGIFNHTAILRNDEGEIIFEGGSVPQIMLLHAWKGKVEFPDLRKIAKEFYEDIRPDIVLIETKANGESLLQELRKLGINVVGFDPGKEGVNFPSTGGGSGIERGSSKTARARMASSLIEGGRVWLPTMAPHYRNLQPFAKEVLEACVSFPEENRDLVDSLSQAFIRILKSRMVTHTDEFIGEKNYKKKIRVDPIKYIVNAK